MSIMNSTILTPPIPLGRPHILDRLAYPSVINPILVASRGYLPARLSVFYDERAEGTLRAGLHMTFPSHPRQPGEPADLPDAPRRFSAEVWGDLVRRFVRARSMLAVERDAFQKVGRPLAVRDVDLPVRLKDGSQVLIAASLIGGGSKEDPAELPGFTEFVDLVASVLDGADPALVDTDTHSPLFHYRTNVHAIVSVPASVSGWSYYGPWMLLFGAQPSLPVTVTSSRWLTPGPVPAGEPRFRPDVMKRISPEACTHAWLDQSSGWLLNQVQSEIAIRAYYNVYGVPQRPRLNSPAA